jgi:integrase
LKPLSTRARRSSSPHGFRATLKTWCEETQAFPHAVVEIALGHQVGNEVERAYRRTDLLEQRRLLMDAWAAYCDRPSSAEVIPLRKAR